MYVTKVWEWFVGTNCLLLLKFSNVSAAKDFNHLQTDWWETYLYLILSNAVMDFWVV